MYMEKYEKNEAMKTAISSGIYKITLCSFLSFGKKEFEKWRAIRASVGGVGGVLAWVAC